MTLTCLWDTLFHIQNLGRYLDLSLKGIQEVRYKDTKEKRFICRSILQYEYKRKTKKKNRAFFNQITLKVYSKGKDKPVNVKLFKNGSIQMTGCKSIEDCEYALEVLETELTKSKFIVNRKMDGIIPKPFVSKPNNIKLEKIKEIIIRMINTNFKVNFKIDRSSLYQILLSKNINCSYEPCMHACVNIKYQYNEDEVVSVFVFQSGSIIIAGARTKDHIIKAYKFITKLLFENYNNIIKKDMKQILKDEGMLDLLCEEPDPFTN